MCAGCVQQGLARGLRLAAPDSGSKTQDSKAQGFFRALGQGHEQQGPARGCRPAVFDSGSKGTGRRCARPVQHAVGQDYDQLVPVRGLQLAALD